MVYSAGMTRLPTSRIYKRCNFNQFPLFDRCGLQIGIVFPGKKNFTICIDSARRVPKNIFQDKIYFSTMIDQRDSTRKIQLSRQLKRKFLGVYTANIFCPSSLSLHLFNCQFRKQTNRKSIGFFCATETTNTCLTTNLGYPPQYTNSLRLSFLCRLWSYLNS